MSHDGFANLIAAWPDGRIKLLILSRLLHLRRERPDLLVTGTYQPLTVDGPRGDHLCAFARVSGVELLIIVVPRFFVALTDGRLEIPAPEVWTDTTIAAPAELSGRGLRDFFTGKSIVPLEREGGAILTAGELLQSLPFAVLLAGEIPGAAIATPG
jgi:(1->4)-alpha-D-glucan 1-alpha-D-glucosylmutase